MATKRPRSRRKDAAPIEPIDTKTAINLPAPTPLAPEMASVDEPVDDPPTNPGAVCRPAAVSGDTVGSNGETVAPYVPAPESPRLSLGSSARKPLSRPPPIDDYLDDLDEVAPKEIPFALGPPPTPVEVTLDSVDDQPPIIPPTHHNPAPITVASQLDDMFGPPTNARKEIPMPPTPIPPFPPSPVINRPGPWRYAALGIVFVLSVLVAVGNIPPSITLGDLWPTETVAANDVPTTVPSRPDEVPTPPAEDTATVAKADPIPDPAELWANRPFPESFPLPEGTVIAGTPPVPTKVAEVVTGSVPPPPLPPLAVAELDQPKPTVAAAVKPTVATAVVTPPKPPPTPVAPKVPLPESLIVSSTGLKPACKAACSWGNVNAKDGFPYTVGGKRDVVCGDVTYSVAAWTKIAEGKERYCFEVTGLSAK